MHTPLPHTPPPPLLLPTAKVTEEKIQLFVGRFRDG